ncbi:site-specific integrase [Dysgonomonas termitidis]|uniref:Site-specific integrase n=1 Tax=Dysgonomonas termitidis TaxID=1516126 RepID=A0ABV9KQF5_9BACT
MKDYTMRFIFDRKNETGFRDNEKKGKSEKHPKRKLKETGLLQIEVRKDGTDKRVYISTNLRIKPEQFSDKNGFTCKNNDNAKSITGKAHSRFREIDIFVSSDKCPSIEYVKYWDKQDFSAISVVEFINSELRRTNASVAVVEYNHSFIRRLEEYGKIKTFEDITYDNIIGLDAVLRKYIISEPTLYKRHSLFKGYIREAINRGLFKGPNPYSLFKNKKGKSKDPIFLTEEEINKLKEYQPNYGYLERTKDLFLFQCFSGLAYADLMKFSKESIKEIDGYRAIQSNREKNDENFITLFLPEAETIANKYKYELPKVTNQKYNEYLKEVAMGAGINKPLVSHSARHTFATYLLNKDIPVETVSRALGHSNIRQTQHYARLLGKKVIDDMKKLL